MEEKAYYLLAEFDGDTQNILAGYQDVLKREGLVGEQTKEIPYHLTLGCFRTQEEALACGIEQICGNTHTIDICLSHIGLFGLRVLFIGPNMNIELLRLGKAFFPDCANGSHPWAAHTTLLIDAQTQILKAIPVLANAFKPIEAKIESVSLYAFFPTQLIRRYKLIDRKR